MHAESVTCFSPRHVVLREHRHLDIDLAECEPFVIEIRTFSLPDETQLGCANVLLPNLHGRPAAPAGSCGPWEDRSFTTWPYTGRRVSYNELESGSNTRWTRRPLTSPPTYSFTRRGSCFKRTTLLRADVTKLPERNGTYSSASISRATFVNSSWSSPPEGASCVVNRSLPSENPFFVYHSCFHSHDCR